MMSFLNALIEADDIELDDKAATDGRLDAVPAIALACKPMAIC